MKKSIVSVALALGLTLGLSVPTLAVESRFADVPAGSWYEAAAELRAEKGIMIGTSETTFSPEATLTETECSVLALRLHDLLQGGDGVFDPAQSDWGKLTLTLADGTELTGYGRTPAALPGVEKANFAFGWWTWGMMGHTSADNFQIELRPDLSFDPEDADYRAAQEALYDWGKAHEGAAALTVGDMTIPGTVRCWMPVGDWVLAFYPDDDEGNAKVEAIREAVYSGAPAPDAWYRDAAYYAAQNELNVGFAQSPASRANFATTLALATGELPQTRQVDQIPDVSECWYSEDVTMLYQAGILTGKDAYGTFDPEGTLTRAEAATMVARVLDESLRVSGPLAPPLTQGYTLTYLRDGVADCGLTYPVCALGGSEENGEGGILLLDGTLLPWPGRVPSFGVEQWGEYAYFAPWDETTEDPYDCLMGLMAADGSWTIPLENPQDPRERKDEMLAFVNERRIDRPYACHDGLYWDLGGHPVSQKFDWCGDLSAQGQGFVGLAGKIYRIQFDF